MKERRFFRNKVWVGLHLVWTTRQRLPLVTPDIEHILYRCIAAEARKLGCTIVALNSMPDHVHLFVLMPTTVPIADLARQVKGVSCSLIRDRLAGSRHFAWAEGYGVFSVCRSQAARVTEYIRGQKEHHAQNDLWPEVEEPREEHVVATP